MVKIFMCGPAGSGKTQLLERLKSKVKHCRRLRSLTGVSQTVLQELGIRSRKDLNDKILYDVQTRIIEIQTRREEQLHNSDIISDSCLINAVVYAYHYLNERGLEATICHKLEAYRKSLIVLLSPVSYADYSDTQMRPSAKGWENMKLRYIEVLDEYKIPFIDVDTLDLDSREKLVSDAVKGNISNDLQTLGRDSTGRKNFPFYVSPNKCDNISIPTIKIFQDRIEQGWTTEEKGKTNRFIHRYGHDRLALLAFDINVRASVVQKLLLGEVRINGEVYSFLGCSSNGLKNRKCFMWKGSADEANTIIEENGNFSEIKTVSKRLSRIGLLFSSVKVTKISICESQIIHGDDIESNGKVFSDGCGGIGKDLAEKLYKEVKETETVENYTPAVYQIRFQGCKGVLAVDSKMPTNSIIVRPSMKKFKTTVYPNICVCDYAKPYTFGKLNKQFIQLLSGLGVPDEVFEKKLSDYLQLILTMLYDKEAAIILLQWKGMFDIAQKVVGIESLDVLQNQNIEIKKTMTEVQQSLVSTVEKLNILIPKSRNIYGVCDNTQSLAYGQCFIRITTSGVPKTIRGQVVVCKPPSYLLGDVRVLEAVDIAELEDGADPLKDLIDCIVFPSCGVRPHPDEIAGSDLDGDMYFVCWDESLIPPATRPPYDYPAATERLVTARITRESIISYFAKQNEVRKMVSRVDKLFNKWADSEGIKSQECERLGCLFSRVIDSSKTGEIIKIPLSLQEPKDATSENNIWVKMKNRALKFKQDFGEKFIQTNHEEIKDHVTESFVKEIVNQPVTNIAEYHKFEFVLKFLSATEIDQDTVVETFLNKYSDFINFRMFSLIEKRSAEDLGIPHAVIANALNKSKILSNEDLISFQMHTSASPWNCYFRKDHDEFDWVHLIKALTEQDRTFIALKLPYQITMVLQFLERQRLGLEQEVKPGTVYALFYSKHFGYVRKYILGPAYLLDFTRDTLQLYRQTKPKSFVWLKAQDWAKNTRKSDKVVCEEIVNAVSIDLLRFDRRILQSQRKHPLITKTPLISLEVFAQNIDETACYFDLVDVNDILPIDDVKEQDDDEACATVEFEKLFPKTVSDEYIDSEDELQRMIAEAVESGNPYHFHCIVERWRPNTLPAGISRHFVRLLESLVQRTTPVPLPVEMQEVIETVLVLIGKTLDNYSDSVQIARSLSMVHCDDMAQAIVVKWQFQEPRTTVNEYIDIVSAWENWWYLGSGCATLILDNLFCLLNEGLLKSEEAEENDFQLKRYIPYFSRLQGLALIAEMQSCKDQMLSGSSESGDSSKCLPADTENSISFLKVDQSEDAEQSFVNFYRMSAVSKRPNICQGQYVALARHIDVMSTHTYKSYCCLGQIREMRSAPFSMTVEIVGSFPKALENCKHTKQTIFWRAMVIGNITTFSRIMKALKQTLTDKTCTESPLFAAVTAPGGFIKDTPLYEHKECNLKFVSDVPFPSPLSLEGLNTAQSKAVTTAVSQSITLIQGPPGTGKTTCACSIVRNIHRLKKNDRILVVAETNIAVDNIARRLMSELLVLRVGADEGIAPDLYDITLTGQMKKASDSISAKRTTFLDDQGISHRNTQLINKILKSADVVLTTCAGAGDPILESVKFEFVLVDEATQTMEPTLLCSLVHGATQLVMIGDPKQLGPHMIETGKSSANLPGLSELSSTVFHRFYESRIIPNICFLDTQHRMHEAIMKFPSECFYDKKLLSGVPKNRPRVNFPWPKGNCPLCFVDISGLHERRIGTSFCNLLEVKAVGTVVDCLLNDDEESREQRLSIDDIGILTTYKAQVKALRQHVKPTVEISSVDGFQGREKEVIVVSTVRSNSNGNLGFSDDRYRINVLLTRAKRGLIIIGNEYTLKSSTIWKRWLQQAPKLHLSAIPGTSSQTCHIGNVPVMNHRK